MKTQKIHREILQRYMYDEIIVEGMCKLADGRVLLSNVYFPPQLDYDELRIDHLWLSDNDAFPECINGKKIQVVGSIYAYPKSRNSYSYSINPDEIWLDKECVWKDEIKD